MTIGIQSHYLGLHIRVESSTDSTPGTDLTETSTGPWGALSQRAVIDWVRVPSISHPNIAADVLSLASMDPNAEF